MTMPSGGSRVGHELVEAVEEMAAFLRGDAKAKVYELSEDAVTSVGIKRIRRKVASSIEEQRLRAPAQRAPRKSKPVG